MSAVPHKAEGGRRLVHVTTVDMSLELLLGPQLRAFVDQGFEVIAISAPGPYVAALEADGIRHISLPGASRSWSLGSDLKAFWSLYRLFRELEPGIVHTHNPKPGVYGRVAARLARVPRVVNTVHGLYALPTDRRRKRWTVYGAERLASTCSDVELVQNDEDLTLMRDTLRMPRRKLVAFGNGVDLTRFDPDGVSPETRARVRREMGATSADDVVIGFVGRMVTEKGIPELIDAAKLVMAGCPNARFALIGFHDPSRNDDVTAEMLADAEAAGITLLGSRHDVNDLYAGMDIFVLPSHREGFPRSVMEASAMGVPVVASDIRGCREAVDHGSSGLLVPKQDAESLATALESLVTDHSARERLGAGARALARARFDVARQVELSLAAYGRTG